MSTKTDVAKADIDILARSWRRSLLAANKSTKTVGIYLYAVGRLAAYLAEKNMPQCVEGLAREHIESFFADLRATGAKPTTCSTYYRSLNVFFNWLVEEGELRESPMRKMKGPTIPDTPPPVLSEDQLRRLLKACEGKGFRDRRDNALIRLLADSGMRRAECAGLKVADIDLDLNVAYVMGKGRRPRACVFGRKTAAALDKYLRVRAHHPHARREDLWLGVTHPTLSGPGIEDMVKRRASQAGLPPIHPHLFRHAFAHAWLAQGGTEGDLMRLGGWSSRTIMSKYGASAASERAREAHKKLSLGDRL